MSEPVDYAFFARAGAATVHEAYDRKGSLDPRIVPIVPNQAIAGPAFCVLCERGDNLAIHRAVAEAARGDIIVASGDGVACGYLGDVLAEAAMARGIAGVVVDGCVRDARELRTMGFPVWARGLAIRGATKTQPGLTQVPVQCGGVRIVPGDLVVADEDGVCAVGQGSVAQVSAQTAKRLEQEIVLRRQLREGALTLDLLNLRQYLQAK